jgi:transposase
MVVSPGGESEHWCIVLIVVEHDGSLILAAEPTRHAVPCPKCGELSRRPHSSYLRRPLDLPWRGHTVRLPVHSRRWFCDEPDCPRQIFAERFDGVLAHYARRIDTARSGYGLAAAEFENVRGRPCYRREGITACKPDEKRADAERGSCDGSSDGLSRWNRAMPPTTNRPTPLECRDEATDAADPRSDGHYGHAERPVEALQKGRHGPPARKERLPMRGAAQAV